MKKSENRKSYGAFKFNPIFHMEDRKSRSWILILQSEQSIKTKIHGQSVPSQVSERKSCLFQVISPNSKTKFDSTVTTFQISKLRCTNWDLKVNLKKIKFFISEILDLSWKPPISAAQCNMTRPILWLSKFKATVKKHCCFVFLWKIPFLAWVSLEAWCLK